MSAARLFERFADQTRRHLKLAGIDRAELVEGSTGLLPFDFRSWRTAASRESTTMPTLSMRSTVIDAYLSNRLEFRRAV